MLCYESIHNPDNRWYKYEYIIPLQIFSPSGVIIDNAAFNFYLHFGSTCISCAPHSSMDRYRIGSIKCSPNNIHVLFLWLYIKKFSPSTDSIELITSTRKWALFSVLGLLMRNNIYFYIIRCSDVYVLCILVLPYTL